jgi:hypothetical protein
VTVSDCRRSRYSVCGSRSSGLTGRALIRRAPFGTVRRYPARFNGTAIYAAGTFANVKNKASQADVVAAYNAVNTPALASPV